MYSSKYDLCKFGSMFEIVRKKNGYSYAYLSELSGVSTNTLRRIEKGEKACRFDTLSLLSYYLKTDLIELLCSSKNQLYDNINQIKFRIDIDLSLREYGNINRYIEELQQQYDYMRYDASNPSIVSIFNLLDKMSLWLKGIFMSVSKKNYLEAELIFVKALQIDYPEFTIDNLGEFHFSGVDISILNSLVSNRLVGGNLNDIDRIIGCLKNILLMDTHLNHFLFTRLCYNVASLHLHRENYEKALLNLEESIEYMNKHNIIQDLALLLLLKAICRYFLKMNDTHTEIIDALDHLKYEKKESLIPIVLSELASVHKIELDYEL